MCDIKAQSEVSEEEKEEASIGGNSESGDEVRSPQRGQRSKKTMSRVQHDGG